jgi:transcriptional regulator with XRE-family HTH domain
MGRLQELARARIRDWLAANPRITQVKLAEAVGMSQTWVSQYKSGEQDADCDQLAVMAQVFGHTLNELFDLRPDPKERALIEAFRALAPEKRDLSIRMLEAMMPPHRGLDVPRERHKERR